MFAQSQAWYVAWKLGGRLFGNKRVYFLIENPEIADSISILEVAFFASDYFYYSNFNFNHLLTTSVINIIFTV